MKKSVRILCLIIAAVFVLSLLYSIVVSIAYAEGSSASSRGETVYVTADANGNVESVISSVYLGNAGKNETLTDYTRLSSIKPITTNDPPAIAGDAVTFAAAGEDVAYQGTASADDLPFTVTLTYFLNGKEIAPKELAGKSGRVRIEISVENHLKSTAEVEGETVELYVPFSVIGMLTLNENFSGVTADNAKISVQAGQVTVMAVLLPGLAESLGMQESEELKDTLTIEATVQNFSLSGGMFIGMTGIVDQNDLSGIESVEDLMNALTELNDAAGELYKGTRQLSKAMKTYAEGVRAYAEGIAQAAEGVGTIVDGVGQLYGGANQLGSGSAELTKGLEALASELEKIQGYLDTFQSGEVNEELYSLLEGYACSAAQEALNESNQRMRSALRAQLASKMPDATAEEIEEIVDAVAPAQPELPQINLTESQKAAIAQAVACIINKSPNAKKLLEQLEQLFSGMGQLADGSAQITDGIYALSDGLYQLKKGLGEFSEGTETLAENGTALADGADSMQSGIAKIASGLKQLSNDGMQRIVDETAEINVSLERKDALITLSQTYNSFSSTRELEEGAVQFVVSIDGIEEDIPITPSPTPGSTDATPTPSATDAGKADGFFQNIGDWFAGIFASIKAWFH